MAWSYVITDALQTHYSFPNNADIVYASLIGNGYSHAAAIGILANMEHESSINPGQGENGYKMSLDHGLGLVQWTPGRNLTTYATGLGADWFNGDVQMRFLYLNLVSGSWIATKDYPYTVDEFKALTDINETTKAFFYEFERGTWHDDLLTYAAYWNTYFINKEDFPISIWYFAKLFH